MINLGENGSLSEKLNQQKTPLSKIGKYLVILPKKM